MMPSTIPANPYSTPARIASTVDLPISARGGVRSMVGSAAARADSASSEISTPGKMTPPRYSPSALTTSCVTAVPKSTITHWPPTRS